jgi:hypothetical protein
MQQELRQAPPMQPNTEPLLKQPGHGFWLPSKAKGEGQGSQGVRERAVVSEARRAGKAGGTTEEQQEHQSAHLQKQQRQPLSNLRTNLIVFFINTRVISLQDKPLLGFFTFFIF